LNNYQQQKSSNGTELNATTGWKKRLQQIPLHGFIKFIIAL